MFLTEKDIIALTGYKLRHKQAEALNNMGIEHRIRPDGHIIVLQSHLETLLGAGKPKVKQPKEPDWSRFHATI